MLDEIKTKHYQKGNVLEYRLNISGERSMVNWNKEFMNKTRCLCHVNLNCMRAFVFFFFFNIIEL